MCFTNYFFKMLGTFLRKVTGIGSTKMVIVVRTDLKMGRGKIASQTAHAAVILYQQSIENSNQYLKTWLRYGQPKIVLKVENDAESTLGELYSVALSKNLNACKVYDAGNTQVSRGTLTALGIGPNKTEEIDEITSQLKLL